MIACLNDIIKSPCKSLHVYINCQICIRLGLPIRKQVCKFLLTKLSVQMENNVKGMAVNKNKIWLWLLPANLKPGFMITSWNGNIFRVTGHLCGEFTGPRWIPHTKASDAELWSLFDLRLNKRLNKQSWGWWFETLSRPLWRHRNVLNLFQFKLKPIHTGDGDWSYKHPYEDPCYSIYFFCYLTYKYFGNRWYWSLIGISLQKNNRWNRCMSSWIPLVITCISAVNGVPLDNADR